MRITSEASPLHIDVVPTHVCSGLIGLTVCPGKKDEKWDRDLTADIERIVAWGAQAVITLVEPHELADLQVPHLGRSVRAAGMHWYDLPIPDCSLPTLHFEKRWLEAGPAILARLGNGERIIVHCRGGLGRTGTIASRLLIELGMTPDAAITAVHGARPNAIETPEQEAYVRNRAWEFRLRQ